MSSPELSLVKATRDFARKHASSRDTDPGSQHGIALLESVYTFVSNCAEEMDDPAMGKLVVFFEVTLGRRIGDGRMGWVGEPKRRPYALQCVEYLAKEASILAKGKGTGVTPAILDHAADVMMQLMMPHCPLPFVVQSDKWKLDESDVKLFSTACADLSNAIGHRLDKMVGGSAGDSGMP